jgi:hypothetical protein
LVLEFGFSTGFGYYRENMYLQKSFAFQSADVLSFGIAAACLKHSVFGDVSLATVEEGEIFPEG